MKAKTWKLGLLMLSAWLAGACQQPIPAPTRIEEEVGVRAPAPAKPIPLPTPTTASSPTATLSPIPLPTVTATPPIGVQCAAPPVPGPNAPFATRAAEGCLHLHLNADEAWAHDAYEIAAMIGYTEQPACAGFGFAISWKVITGNGEGIQWSVNRQGVESIWKGDQGIKDIGCGFLTLRNLGAGPVDIDVRVVVDVP